MKNKLWEILKDEGLTQTDLGKLTGIAQTEISKIMNDRKPKLTLSQAMRIAKALNRRIEDIWPY